MNDPRGLLQKLQDSIKDGSPESAAQACRHLNTAQAEGLLPLIESHRLKGANDSLLHLAALFQQNNRAADLLRILARLCPRLLVAQRGGQYQGQTALHIVVSKRNLPGAEALLKEMDGDELLNVRATGTKFRSTVMEGELALHTAALTLNWTMVDLLLRHGARLDTVNSRGDTVLHALVRFAGQHPDKTDKVIEMLQHLHAETSKKTNLKELYKNKNAGSLGGLMDSDGMGDQLFVWFLKNLEGLTPFKLAARKGAGIVCAHIFSLHGVYCLLDTHDGLFDTHLYDITELDPITNILWQNKRKQSEKASAQTSTTADARQVQSVGGPSSSKSKVEPLDNQSQRGGTETESRNSDSNCLCAPDCCCNSGIPDAPSVLEIICGDQALCLLSTDVVRQVVSSKWRRLRGVYFIWFFIHLFFMVGLTSYAIYRPRFDINNTNNSTTIGQDPSTTNTSVTNDASDSLTSAQKGLVKAWPWMSVALSVFYIGVECVRIFSMSFKWHLRCRHHNGLYRVILVLFSLCLLIDSLWFWIDKHNADSNIFLILALLLGDLFLTFFLRAWRKFAFFTFLFQKVLMGDMFRFSFIFLIELIAFSAAMYVAYLPAGSYELPEEFEDVWSSILTMFRLMLGLSDVEVLSKAPAAWLTVGLYVAFVLLTYVLLLNSLIAMISQTCEHVTKNRDPQWRMQRLSVLLMIESMLPLRCRPVLGQRDSLPRYCLKMGHSYKEDRYRKRVTPVQASYEDGKEILRRQNLGQLGFRELALKLVPRKTLDNNERQRRHNSERKNRRTQTNTNEPLFRSYPDIKLRGNIHATPGSPNLMQEESDMPVLFEPHLHNVPFGLVHQPFSNSSLHQQVAYTNLAQPFSNGQFQSNAYTSAIRAPTYLSVLEHHQLFQQANSSSQAPQPQLVPSFSDRIPEQAKRANFGARVQFIDVNDLNKEV
ncbi:transient receptor potential cation channel subfamily v member 6 [Plakobranchus ocellatus]|uniref:Transient receptor potential cation channel subfamily v member 6 n=1 Tax=Plakobranchus ocellatus TaxID=259542 RepID=A0AAV3ZHM7_9GAST|nr:transient receptor potential cation channel subfamily v member 6 [Plakobranchus ocellatus]